MMNQTPPTPVPATAASDAQARARFWRRLHRRCELGLLAVYLLRYAFHDRLPGLSVLYYATPPAVMVGLALLMLGMSLRLGRAKLFWTLACLLLAGRWYLADWRWQSATDIQNIQAEPAVTVLLWNIGRPQELAPTGAYINSVGADVVVLVEAGRSDADRRQAWKSACPDYDVSLLGGGIVLLAKGTSGESRAGVIGPGSISRTIAVSIRGIDLNLIIADVCSYPHLSRAQPLQALADMTLTLSHEPLLVLGDFNTPPDSVHFRPLRQMHRQAFEAAGNGYAPTWPLPAPVLELDQVWVNRHLRAVDCRHLWTNLSDHRPVLTTLTTP